MRDVGPDLIEALSSVPLFEGLAPERLRELARASHTAAWQKGGTIFRTGELPQVLFVVLSGHVKRAMTSQDGDEKVLDVLSRGRMFGEAELFGGLPYGCYAVAAVPAVLLCIGGDALRRVMGADAALSVRVLLTLAHRQYDMENEFAVRQFRSGGQRVLDYFVRLAGAAFSPQGKTPVFLPVSKQLVAARIGITPESFSRALRDFSDEGLIAVRGRHILLDNARVARLVGGFGGSSSVQGGAGLNRRRTDPRPVASVLCWPAPTMARPPFSIGYAVNLAGRQRMLSQRLATSWLMPGLPTRQAHDALGVSIREFECRMGELSNMDLTDGAGAARESLADVWLPYKALLGCPPGPCGTALVLDQSESVLAAAQALTQALAEADGTAVGCLISMAGRLRMLSQRMAKYFLIRQRGMGSGCSGDELERAGDEFGAILGQLLEAPQGTPGIRTELVRVSRQWRLFQSLLSELEGDGGLDAASRIVAASDRVLERCESTVSLYEKLAA